MQVEHMCVREIVFVWFKVHEEEENHTQPKAHTHIYSIWDGPF